MFSALLGLLIGGAICACIRLWQLRQEKAIVKELTSSRYFGAYRAFEEAGGFQSEGTGTAVHINQDATGTAFWALQLCGYCKQNGVNRAAKVCNDPSHHLFNGRQWIVFKFLDSQEEYDNALKDAQ